jgi:hypothetical protein
MSISLAVMLGLSGCKRVEEQVVEEVTDKLEKEALDELDIEEKEESGMIEEEPEDEKTEEEVIGIEEEEEITNEKKEAPAIKLEIYEGPINVDGIYYFRVEAIVTGNPSPTIEFSRDDSNSAWGSNIAQVNLSDPDEEYTLTATATNSEGSDTATVIVGNIHIGINLEEDSVFGAGWPVRATFILTIDDPNTPQNPDYTKSQKNSNVFNLSGVFDIQAGQIVTMTDGVLTKTHVVRYITVEKIDQATDTVSGTADPGTGLVIVACAMEKCTLRVITADVNGNWMADFSIPGELPDEQGVFDIRPGTSGSAVQGEGGGDTNILWQL